jgi:FAD/FMN-containing dehydrogenase
VVAKDESERAALWAIRDNMDCLAGYVRFKGFDVSVPLSRMEAYTEPSIETCVESSTCRSASSSGISGMGQLNALFDPKGILNAGKVL